ncbi:MAG: hypothetical protein HOV87_24495 [Catenulispora sp.]|nr:hypothetical protein [Catenulispora sp.]
MREHMTLMTKGRARSFIGTVALLLTTTFVPTGTADAVSAAAKPVGAANVQDVCGPAKPGYARCFAVVRTDIHGGTGVRGKAAAATVGHAIALPDGYGPADLHAAYHLPMTGGVGQTVAIVDAGDDANAEADLALYRGTYGLPPCSTANGCFHKVNQRGFANPLPTNQHWGIEIALDLEMVSAACPDCRILLVEADTAWGADLAASVDTADADPDTGPAVYDTVDGVSGWIVVGGTSAAAPFVAGVVALAGHPGEFGDASRLYSAPAGAGLIDVTGGSNASSLQDCGGDYQCTAGSGYDGPTGNGTPNGLAAF